MKKNIVIIIAVLLAATAIVTAVYLNSREEIGPGQIMISSGSGTTKIDMKTLDLEPVSGTITKKNGETKKIDSTGYRLGDISSLVNITDYSEISVYADDEYSATVSREELEDDANTWLIEDDEGIRLVVLGDTYSGRDVKNVKRIEIR